MSEWIHLILKVKDDKAIIKQLIEDATKDKPTGIYKDWICYLKKIVDSLSPELINRYFYLFEFMPGNPHLFLALDIKKTEDIPLINDKISKVGRPSLIESAVLDQRPHVKNEREAALDFYCAGTRYAFFRVTNDYEPGYLNSDETKMAHCFCNQMFIPEKLFYIKCLEQNCGIRIQKK